MDRRPRQNSAELVTGHSFAVGRVLDRLDVAIGRMREGIHTLESSARLLQAFRLANLAMAMQMRHSEDDLGGTRKRRNEVTLPDVDSSDLDRLVASISVGIHIAVTLPSWLTPRHSDRAVVD